GEVGAEQQRDRCGERGRHRAEDTEADVDPGHAGTEPAEAEGETEQGGIARGSRMLPEQEQQREAEQRQRSELEGRVSGDGQRAQRCGDEPLEGAARSGHRWKIKISIKSDTYEDTTGLS